MKTPRFVRYSLGLGLFVGGVAFAAPKEPHIAVRLPRASYNVVLNGKEVVSPSVQLSHSRKEMRGRIGDAPAVISFEGNKITGNVGSSLVNLKLTQKGDTVEAEGGFLGGPVQVRYNPEEEVHLYINQCTYRLKGGEERSYAGRRSCDGGLMPDTEITLPAEFSQLSPGEQVMLLLLSLG